MIDWILAHPILAILVALATYFFWHFFNALRLYIWIRNPDRKKPGSLGLWKDIFARIASMEQRNRRQKKRYQSMIADFRNVTDAFPDATLIIDENARLTWFNSAARALLDLRGQEEIGRPVTNLVRDTSFTDWLEALDGNERRL